MMKKVTVKNVVLTLGLLFIAYSSLTRGEVLAALHAALGVLDIWA